MRALEWFAEQRREALAELGRVLVRFVVRVMVWALVAAIGGALGYAVFLHVRIGDADIKYQQPVPTPKIEPEAEPPRNPWEGEVKKVE